MKSFKFLSILGLSTADDRHNADHPVEKMDDLLNQVDWIGLVPLGIFLAKFLLFIFLYLNDQYKFLAIIFCSVTAV